MINTRLKKIIAYLLVTIIPCSSLAQNRPGVSDPFTRSISEYFYSRTGNEILKPIRIIGGVLQPGVYHVPAETDLGTLISISGGVLGNSDVTKVRFTQAGQKTRELDLYDHIDQGHEIKLQGGEIVFIPQKTGWISSETATTLSIVLGFISVGLTAYVISRGN